MNKIQGYFDSKYLIKNKYRNKNNKMGNVLQQAQECCGLSTSADILNSQSQLIGKDTSKNFQQLATSNVILFNINKKAI